MVKALILKTDGTYVEQDLAGYKDIQKAVDGGFEMLPRRRIHRLEDGSPSKNRLVCYVNDEGLMKHMKSNGWGMVLDPLGFFINWEFGGLYGNAVLVCEGKGGNDKDVDPYAKSLIAAFAACEDEDEFLTKLAKEQSPPKKKAPEKKAFPQGVQPSSESKEKRKADATPHTTTKKQKK
jgi:hypothetical protein